MPIAVSRDSVRHQVLLKHIAPTSNAIDKYFISPLLMAYNFQPLISYNLRCGKMEFGRAGKGKARFSTLVPGDSHPRHGLGKPGASVASSTTGNKRGAI